jgi:hypothetical protein
MAAQGATAPRAGPNATNRPRRTNRFGLPESCQAPKSNIFLFTRIPISVIYRPSRTLRRGDAHRHVSLGAGCDGRFGRQVIDSPGRNAAKRTAKSCGPGAATLASIPAGPCWRGNGDNKGRSPGRVRISRKPIARGRPGCLGCTCQNRVRCFQFLHTALRVHPAPGLPCALCPGGSNEMASPGRKRVAGMRRRVCLFCRSPSFETPRDARLLRMRRSKLPDPHGEERGNAARLEP